MSRTYIGYGYTNSEGVATLDYDSEGNQLPKKSYACHSSRVSVVAEASIDNVITSSNSIRFCEGYVPPTDTLSLTADKSVLSYADNDSCTLTATYEGETVSGKSVVFKVGDTVLDTIQTDSNGVAEYTYNSQGVGDVTFTVECMNLQETYVIEDCLRDDSASSDKTSSYGSIISYRGGSGQWNYNATNGYYGTISGSNEVMVDLTELTGEDDFTIEFDALFTANDGTYYGIAGICAYEDNNNYSRLSCHSRKIAQRVSVNGSASENENDVSSVSRNDLLHFKFTITNNQIVEEVTKGTTSVGTKTINYTPTSNTKYGIAFVWNNNWVSNTFLKNIKIKPL